MDEKQILVIEKMKEAGKPLRPGDVAELTGISKDELSKIIKTLKTDGKIFSPKRCFYEPTGE